MSDLVGNPEDRFFRITAQYSLSCIKVMGNPNTGLVHDASYLGQQITSTYLSRLVGKQTMWFPNRSNTNRPVQAQKQARSLKFWIYKVEELYYPCSKNKDADQLRSYYEADLRLCFRLCRLLVFPCGGSFNYLQYICMPICFLLFLCAYSIY